MAQGIQPKMGWAHGELEISVNGEIVYSYKHEPRMPSDAALLQRIHESLGS